MKNTGGVEQCLRELGVAVIPVKGTSMWPLFREDNCRIKVLTVQEDTPIKQGDIVLYRRPDGTLILHRIVQTTEEGFFVCGDHQWKLEEKIQREQILGLAQGWYRNGHYIEQTAWRYRLYNRFWNKSMPVRRCCLAFLRLSGLERRSLKKHMQKQK